MRIRDLSVIADSPYVLFAHAWILNGRSSPSKTGKMNSLTGALISVWALLSYYACSAEDGVTMQKLRESRLWKDDQTTLILTQQGPNSTPSLMCVSNDLGFAYPQKEVCLNVIWKLWKKLLKAAMSLSSRFDCCRLEKFCWNMYTTTIHPHLDCLSSWRWRCMSRVSHREQCCHQNKWNSKSVGWWRI